jgi:ABC-type multidrug transport system ATPase subunit
MLGILRSDRGAVSVLGGNPWRHDSALHQRMGVVLEHDGFWGNLTFEQNLRLFATAKNVSWNEARSYVEEFWSMTDICNSKKPVKFFSRGQRMQCALCRAFLGWPSVYLLDEPAVALDVEAYDHFTALAKRAREGGATVLISSHRLETIDELCDRVGLLRDKKITELHDVGRRRGAGPLWELDADPGEQWPPIIEATCGAPTVFENGGYRFRVHSPREAIPLLVKRLVDAGCSIRKIAPAEKEFSAAIRSAYRKKGADEAAQEEQLKR